MKIGVFICHCGSNIAGTVDCGKVAEIAKTYPDVAFSTDTMYTCSEPGQEEIVAAIKEHKLDGVVVASCTPRMHEPTFRRTVEDKIASLIVEKGEGNVTGILVTEKDGEIDVESI